MIILYLNKDVKAYNPARVLIISLMILTFAAVFFTGCDENGGITIPSGTTELTLSAKSDESLANPPAVIITEVKALIHQVQLEQETNQNNQTITFEPFVVNFIINGNLKEMTTKYIIRDFYTKVKFQLHKPEDNEVPPDPEFVSGTQKFSFIVKGTYNGSSFVYRSKRTSYVVVNFENTANINLTTMNVTVLFNKLGWFKNGSVDLDPRVAANETLIDENIKNSFKKAFLDNDKNGLPD
ncbi:MAG TPA: hypothetical protein VJ455_11190 [Ignavibacteria bacterium]|nr:hypothetical protein [Ignavibacteria bacterium]